MNEIWKPIKSYENLYEVSNLGNIKSLDRIIFKKRRYKIIQYHQKERILKPANLNSKLNNSYLVVNLSKNGEAKQFLVHQLVAEAFLNKSNFKLMPNENKNQIKLNELEINHKDEDKQNNCIDNLEWCTKKYNNNYGNKLERQSIAQRNDFKKSKRINQYDLKGNFIRTWISMKEIERQLGIYAQHIYRCCKGKRKSTGGFLWKYKADI